MYSLTHSSPLQQMGVSDNIPDPSLYLQKGTLNALNMKVGGRQSLSDHSGEEKNLLPLPGFECQKNQIIT